MGRQLHRSPHPRNSTVDTEQQCQASRRACRVARCIDARARGSERARSSLERPISRTRHRNTLVIRPNTLTVRSNTLPRQPVRDQTASATRLCRANRHARRAIRAPGRPASCAHQANRHAFLRNRHACRANRRVCCRITATVPGIHGGTARETREGPPGLDSFHRTSDRARALSQPIDRV